MSKNKLPPWATTVTPLSKTIALLMFILLPIAAFYYGTYYQKQMDTQQPVVIPTPSAPAVSQPAEPSASMPPNGKISCKTNADCPPDYTCAQPGPIRYGEPQRRSCWKRGSMMPL